MKNIRYILITSVLTILLQACATPTFEPKVAHDAAGSIPHTWSTMSDSREVQAGWIETFKDELLNSLVLEAQQHNREIQNLAATIDQSMALARQAGAVLLPSINLDASSTRQSQGDFITETNAASVQISWELDLWGRIRSERNAALADTQAVIADYRFAQYSLAASVARAYFAAIDAQIQMNIVQQSKANLQRIYDLVELQVREGIASQQDLAVSRSDLASVRSRLAEAEGAKRDALRALELLLGRYPSADLKVRQSLPDIPVQPTAGLPSDLLERRPDLIAAERRVAAAFQRLNAAKAARLPRISLSSSFGGVSSELSSLLEPANRTWSTGGSLLAPIFQGGALKAQVDQANAEQKSAIAAYGQTALNAFNDVETSLDAGGVLLRQETELQEALAAANKAYRIAKFRFDEGDMDLFDLLSIEQRTFDRRVELTSIQHALLEQRVKLFLALGGSWETSAHY